MFQKWRYFDFLFFLVVFLTTPRHKNAHNSAALHLTIFFKLDHVPDMILHQIAYFLLCDLKIVAAISKQRRFFLTSIDALPSKNQALYH